MTGFLQCDAEGCDHKEYHETATEDMIDKPCPKCGASLLTEEDFRAFEKFHAAFEALEALGLVKFPKPGETIPEGHQAISVHGHKNKVTITTKDAGEVH